MAGDMAALMQALGHERFTVAGHDRGAYVALRLAMDRPDAVERLVFMDAIPIAEALERCDARFARAWWHWFFLGQTAKPAERVISADPDAWYSATAIWRAWADDVRGMGFDSGHHIGEDAPEALAAALVEFAG
jgi:haloacetate dehalogenase